MFENKSNHYITREVNKEVDIRLQLLMWSIIDNLNEKGNIEVDYSQVFELRKKGISIVIKYYQEVLKYEKVYSLTLEDIELDRNMKIYIIDSGEYSTILFSVEY